MRNLGRTAQSKTVLVAGGVAAIAIACGAALARESAIGPPAAMTAVGTLTCSLGAENKSNGINPAAQGREVLCRFLPNGDAPTETYVGTVQGVGKADALFAGGAILLSVRAPSPGTAPGMLQQSYSIDAAPKGASPPLVGGRSTNIVLQPLKEEVGRVERGDITPDSMIVLLELTLQSSSA
jgi:hypothetical protein